MIDIDYEKMYNERYKFHIEWMDLKHYVNYNGVRTKRYEDSAGSGRVYF